MLSRISFLLFSLLILCNLSFAQDDSEEEKIVSYESLQVTVPGNWNILDLHDEAEIGVGNEIEEQYLIVLSEKKEDLYGWNLKKHSFITLGNLISGLLEPNINGPNETTIGGQPAIQFVIAGVSEGTRLVYIHTTVETDSSFNQIVSWSLKSRYKANKNTMNAVINSFKEE